MVVFPNCKINLGLNIIQKRKDGYHDLETIFLPVPLRDVLEINTATNFAFSSSGLPISGNEENNLCIKAYRLLKKDFPELPAVHMHLHKIIPMGAGLGGGSADGAFTLQTLNQKFKLNISTSDLVQYALQLGSDCPFFIYNTPCFAEGRGELLSPLTNIDFTNYRIVLINPGIHVTTATAFQQIVPKKPELAVTEAIKQPISSWKDCIINDFEEPVVALFPEIKNIKSSLYEHGALYAAMTGTGSTVFGLFDKAVKLNLNFPAHYFVFEQA